MLKTLIAKESMKFKTRNSHHWVGYGIAKRMATKAKLEYLIIGVVPKRITSLLVKMRGTRDPAPLKPMIAPHSSLETSRFSMNSGIRGNQERVAKPWVKKVTIRAN